jgi:hypothetical protein
MKEVSFHPPPLFSQIIFHALNSSCWSDSFAADYLYHYRNNSLEKMITQLGLNRFVDVLKEEFLIREKNNIDNNIKRSSIHLDTIGKLMLMEEIQMSIDIAQYDLHYFKVFLFFNLNDLGFLKNTFLFA